MGESRKHRSWRRCYERGIAQFKIYCYNTHRDSRWLCDTILILKNQQATSSTAILWKSEHPRTDILNKFV